VLLGFCLTDIRESLPSRGFLKVSVRCQSYPPAERTGRCSNLVLKNADTIFLGANSGENCWKNSPLSRNSVPAERKRPGRGGVMLTEGHQRSDANHIAWINLL